MPRIFTDSILRETNEKPVYKKEILNDLID